MAFITVHKIYDDTAITINTDHIVYFEEGSEGGTTILLTPATGPGASMALTVRQDYQTLAQDLGA